MPPANYKALLSKILAGLLALVAVVGSAVVPVRAAAVSQQRSEELVELQEEVYLRQQTGESRRVHPKRHQDIRQLFRPRRHHRDPVAATRATPPPDCFWFSIPPLLRAPPA